MKPMQIARVRESFAMIKPIANTAAAMFYARLFELDPSLRRLFIGDMEHQGRTLMQVIDVAVANLGRLEAIGPTLRDLGRRHARYGVEDRHYVKAGKAFLWTLEQVLGEDFTPDVRQAWLAAYGALAQTMLDGVEMAKAA